MQPVEAVQEHGGRGLIPGIGKGLGGAFFKPMTGKSSYICQPPKVLSNILW
jgi:hypothetical protein